ncbi:MULTISPECIES: hypothetical protein [unclassified Pseudoalteromonas]|uniref:hypothetical protein n=1 Tax=unclassified Pseudoalteromonas TaxID=194690 RepID=UPI000C06C0F7|nr:MULTISPECIES: hypothetical protein [unclassified Pseudoalteromonas]MDP2633973.1 hypothetical protein [Pseudoalteromonas sp. 1_MG-2023]PHN90792.1 hypothetical protein CSC79_06570 [Pseudoalteromonas sp. 3D05]
MYLTEHFGLSLGALVVWGFMMAFFFNLFLWFADLKRNKVLLITSFVAFISYFVSDHLFTWYETSNIYLQWAIYDILTLSFILIGAFFVKGDSNSPAYQYVVLGLIVNTLLFFFMYYDLHVVENTTPWILWDIYSFGVNIVDFTMIVALIVDRDILGLIRLKNGIKALFSARKTSHSL